MMTIQITESRLLVVEGKDEELFFEALIEHMGLRNIQVLPVGGKAKLRPSLKALALSPGFSQVVSLGIVRDADENATAGFQSVCDALKDAGLRFPDRCLSPAGSDPAVTVMILPGQNKAGTLEDLCLESVAQDPAMGCVEEYFQCLEKQGLHTPQNLSKARVQVFLASKQEAGKRLGEAAQAGYLPWDNRAFEQVKEFLRQLGF
ncbi:MAG: hypothetical protein NZ823_00990 [Blastocatellia bacterium]|nr:hypothetical protein [Blastocatellia bacterium]